MTMRFVPAMFPDEMYTSISNRHDQLEGAHYTRAGSSATATWHKYPREFSRYSLLFEKKILDFNAFAWAHTFAPMLPPASITEKKIADLRLSKLETKMCSECIKNDIKALGAAYFHRSHNFPGIDVCHSHGVRLAFTCAACNVPHSGHKVSAYYTCIASLEQTKNITKDTSNIELRIAIFLHHYLNRSREMTNPHQHDTAIHSRAIDLGLYYKTQFSKKSITKFTNNYYTENLPNTYFDSTLTSQYRTEPFKILRILFALFQNFEQYCNYYNNHGTLNSIPGKTGQILQSRNKFLIQLQNSHASNAEDFQKANWALTAWLRKEDSSWTSWALSKHFISPTQKRVAELRALEPLLYDDGMPPERVTFARISKALGIKGSYSPRHHRKEIHLEYCNLTESFHHYYIRLILWTAQQAENETLTIAALSNRITVSTKKIKPLVEQWKWVGADQLIHTNTLPKSINELKIDKKWTLN